MNRTSLQLVQRRRRGFRAPGALAVTALGAWLALPGVAAAASPHQEPRHREGPEASLARSDSPFDTELHRHAEDQNLLGVKVGSVFVVEPFGGPEDGPHAFPAWSAALFYERTLVHNWLELELSAPVGVGTTVHATHVFLPFNLHFKKPFHPTPWLSPYIGLGPMLDVYLAPERRVAYGGSFTAGTFIWPPNSPVGVDIDLEYDLVENRGRAGHEFMLALGPIWRF